MDDLLADFLTETREQLVALDDGLLRLERVPDDAAALAQVFRLIHTIKGTCGFLGLPRLEAVAHAAETVLGRCRDGALAVTPDGVSRILQAVDVIRGIVGALGAAGTEPPGTDAGLIAALEAAAAGEPAVHCRHIAPASPAVPAAAPQTVRVAVQVLDDLMVLVSELVLTRNRLLQAARGMAAADGLPLQRLTHLTAELQGAVMRTRMQPIGQAWARLPRLVRDLGRDLGKRIELEMTGAGTELDRQVLELITDPLVHMVRNAADHGLEAPAARRLAGKPDHGTIRLGASHRGGHVVIELDDDGGGLDLGRIRARALAQGLTPQAALATMPDRELQRLIFRPGFSTAPAITALSGRGVGMDVAKTNLERIGGTIEVRSQAGRGTGFTITIPLTLAIAAVLIVQAGGGRFAIPQPHVLEVVRVEAASGSRVERIGGAAVLRLRDRLLPLVALSTLLDLPATPGPAFVVVMEVGAEVLGILVDRVFDTEEVVVKPVAPILRHLSVFAGTAILGDGGVTMILDAGGIARMAGLGAEPGGTDRPEARPAEPAPSDRPTALLLFQAAGEAPKAVPLAQVFRLEEWPPASIETVGGRTVAQYRGGVLPLLPLAGAWNRAAAPERQPVLVLAAGDRRTGLLVDAILDVVEARLEVDPAGKRPGTLGHAVIGGLVAEVIDAVWWVRRARPEAENRRCRAAPP